MIVDGTVVMLDIIMEVITYYKNGPGGDLPISKYLRIVKKYVNINFRLIKKNNEEVYILNYHNHILHRKW